MVTRVRLQTCLRESLQHRPAGPTRGSPSRAPALACGDVVLVPIARVVFDVTSDEPGGWRSAQGFRLLVSLWTSPACAGCTSEPEQLVLTRRFDHGQRELAAVDQPQLLVVEDLVERREALADSLASEVVVRPQGTGPAVEMPRRRSSERVSGLRAAERISGLRAAAMPEYPQSWMSNRPSTITACGRPPRRPP
jgi:hypothetical protein